MLTVPQKEPEDEATKEAMTAWMLGVLTAHCWKANSEKSILLKTPVPMSGQNWNKFITDVKWDEVLDHAQLVFSIDSGEEVVSHDALSYNELKAVYTNVLFQFV